MKPRLLIKIGGRAFEKETGFSGFEGMLYNLKKETILIVCIGEKPTGGYHIKITEVKLSGNDAIVYYTEKTPSEGSVTTQVITSPYYIKIAPKISGTITLKKQ